MMLNVIQGLKTRHRNQPHCPHCHSNASMPGWATYTNIHIHLSFLAFFILSYSTLYLLQNTFYRIKIFCC